VGASDLRDRLADVELEHATLLAEVDAFYGEWMRRVGVIDVQLQGLLERIAEATEPEVEHPSLTATLEFVPDPPGPPPTEDLKTLFRDAAKRIHPDLQADGAGRGHAEAFMKRLNQAYAAGDADAIGNLVRQWETSPYAAGTITAGPSPALAAAVEQAEQRLAETRASDLAQLMERVFMASMHGQDLLQELRWEAEEALSNARIRLAGLDK
jgi:hypothetical protein